MLYYIDVFKEEYPLLRCFEWMNFKTNESYEREYRSRYYNKYDDHGDKVYSVG